MLSLWGRIIELPIAIRTIGEPREHQIVRPPNKFAYIVESTGVQTRGTAEAFGITIIRKVHYTFDAKIIFGEKERLMFIVAHEKPESERFQSIC